MMVELEDVGIIEENDIKIVVRKSEGTSGTYSWKLINKKDGSVCIYGAGPVGKTDEEAMHFLRKNYSGKDLHQ